MLDLLGNGGIAALTQTLRDNAPLLVALGAALGIVTMVARLAGNSRRAARAHSDQPGVLGRIAHALMLAFTTNWQLTLLAITAFVLSLASGWTTWDGMRNFTGEPVLSLMVTFGIQGVMLIIAWLIGESFSAGMGRRSSRGQSGSTGAWSHIEPAVGMVVGSLCALSLMWLAASQLGLFDDLGRTARGGSVASFADKALYFGIGLLVVATLLINQKSDVIQPYIQSARIIARNAVLWVMFLSCAATSVFFSFDSLFSSIFPADERKRAADIRAQRQVAGVVNDIGALALRRQSEEAELLFQSQGWKAYERHLANLARNSQGAEQEIERYFVERMEAHKTAMAAQQERISSSRSGQAGLSSRKAILGDELARLKTERPALAAELAEKKTELDNRNKAIDLKRVEAMAEERGAEGTLKQGKGPVYRQRVAELDQMRDAIKIQDERVRDAQKRMTTADTRISQIEREIVAIDADMAKLKGEAATAEQRIAVAEATKGGAEDGPKVDPARVRTAFERAHSDFRQQPNVERLSALAQQCTQLHTAMLSTPATKDRVRDIDCDPKQATEAAGRVFALNQGLVVFAQNCSGGSKLPASGDTDALLGFGRKCLQDSGLPSQDAGDMAARISAIDLNRDDKAHRFVVTWNAFADGNRLAYLALSIAIAIDSLVFMSGLFGANAVRSPLTDIEDRGAMTADQLEATIDAALHDSAHARLTLSTLLRSLHPIAGHGEFTSEIVLDEHDPLIGEMRQVLAMGTTIGAVRRHGEERSQYLVHSGLVRYFAVALSKSWKVKAADVDRKELINVIGVALLPDPQGNAEVVLSELHPISDAQGFAAEASPFKIVEEAKRRLVINALGAGATVAGAVRRNNDDGRYFVSTEFYKTLLMMRAAAIPAFHPHMVAQRYARAGLAAAGEHQPRGIPAANVAQIGPPQLHSHGADASPTPANDVRPGMRQHQDSPAKADGRGSVPVMPPGSNANAMPPPVPPAMQVAKPPLSEENEASLGHEIRSDIIHLGGLHAWSERDIEIARALGAGSEPEQALRRLSARAPRLAELVGQTIDENRASVREAYEYLLASRGGNAVYGQVLETVAIELHDLMPVLMLTPGGPYQQILEHQLVDKLERQAGEGALSASEDLLLARARLQVKALREIADSAADRYQRVVRIIEQYDERDAADAGVAKPLPRSSVG